MGFRGPIGYHNNELDDRTDTPCGDIYAQGLSKVLLVNRTRFVLSEIRWVIYKSLFGEAAAKSDLARSGFVHTVGKPSSTGSSTTGMLRARPVTESQNLRYQEAQDRSEQDSISFLNRKLCERTERMSEQALR